MEVSAPPNRRSLRNFWLFSGHMIVKNIPFELLAKKLCKGCYALDLRPVALESETVCDGLVLGAGKTLWLFARICRISSICVSMIASRFSISC